MFHIAECRGRTVKSISSWSGACPPSFAEKTRGIDCGGMGSEMILLIILIHSATSDKGLPSPRSRWLADRVRSNWSNWTNKLRIRDLKHGGMLGTSIQSVDTLEHCREDRRCSGAGLDDCKLSIRRHQSIHKHSYICVSITVAIITYDVVNFMQLCPMCKIFVNGAMVSKQKESSKIPGIHIREPIYPISSHLGLYFSFQILRHRSEQVILP